MEIINKLKWVLTLLLIFFLILATNLIDRNNFRKIKNSVVTIYEDRIVAKRLIFNYLELMHEKELAIATTDASFFSERNTEINTQLTELTAQYQNTKLTNKESKVFEDFQEKLDQLTALEASRAIPAPSDTYQQLLNEVKVNLNDLSEIQLQEGRNQMAMSKNTFEEVESFTRIENYFLIALAILVPIIIFGSSRSLKKIFGSSQTTSS